METQAEILAGFQFFKGLPDHALDTLARAMTLRDIATSAYIAQEGWHAGEFYAIQSGQVAIELHRPGHGRQILQTLQAGDVAGWSWLFPPHRWTFDVRAMTEVQLIVLPGVALLDLFAAWPDVGYHLVRRLAEVMAHRLQAARLQILDVYGNRFDAPLGARQSLGS